MLINALIKRFLTEQVLKDASSFATRASKTKQEQNWYLELNFLRLQDSVALKF